MIIMEHLYIEVFVDFLDHREKQSVPQLIHRMAASPEPLKRWANGFETGFKFGQSTIDLSQSSWHFSSEL